MSKSMSTLLAASCTKCGKIERETARLFGLKSRCRCKEPGVLRCKCGWVGPATKTTRVSSYLIVDCPECGAVVQGLTAEKRKLIEAETGRAAGDNMAIVNAIMRRHFAHLSGELRDAVLDAGSEAVIVAMIRWNPALGFTFGTYATAHCSGRMRNTVRDWVNREDKRQAYLARVKEVAAIAYEEDFAGVDAELDYDGPAAGYVAECGL